MFNIPVWTYVWTLTPAEHLKYVNLKFTRMKNEINSQSLEDTQVGYISQEYTLYKYTLEKYT